MAEIRVTLTKAEIEEAKARAQRWAASHNLAYADIAARARVSEDDVKEFMCDRLSPDGLRATRIAAHFAHFLPIGLSFRSLAITLHEN